MVAHPATGGGRWVEVEPARLSRWLDGFTARHGVPVVTAETYGPRLLAADGTVAELHAPPGVPAADAELGRDLDRFVAAAAGGHRIGLLLVRRGGYGVGVAGPSGLQSSKVDSAYVQSRTAAGGWSQQRFARRRENQARILVTAATASAVRVLLPEAAGLSALVCGGDRVLVDRVLADRRLAPLLGLRADRFLDTADPRLPVLRAAAARARAVRVRVVDPEPGGAATT